MIRGFRHKYAAIVPQVTAKLVFVDQVTVWQPEEAQYIRIAFEKKTDELSDFVADGVPFSDELFLYFVATKTQIVLQRPDIDAHQIFVVDTMAVGLRYVHFMGYAAAVAEEYEIIRKQFGDSFTGHALQFYSFRHSAPPKKG